ncbi:MAG: pyridoxamine 5'-phosphate oxidase family protein [Jatrophihabitantaceae bacterium]
MSDVLPEAGSPFGARVRERLTGSQLAWLTSTGADGTPQPNPVWFLWDGAERVVVYNRPAALRLKHIARRPRVALNLDGDGHGGDIIVLTGDATLAPDTAPAHENARLRRQVRDGDGSSERKRRGVRRRLLGRGLRADRPDPGSLTPRVRALHLASFAFDNRLVEYGEPA